MTVNNKCAPLKLSAEEISAHIEKVKLGEQFAMTRLTFNALTYHQDESEVLRAVFDVVFETKLFTDTGVLQNLVELASLTQQYEKAFSLTDDLLKRGELRTAYRLYPYLYESGDEDVQKRVLNYLKISAAAGHFRARKELVYHKVRHLRWLGRIISSVYILLIAPQMVKIYLNDPKDPRVDIQ